MAATELATAYLSLVPSMRGAQGKIARELSSVDADGIGKGLGTRMGSGLAGSLKGLVGPALAGLAAVGFGGIIAEAARASDATDKFKGTLDFAGVDTSGIEAATAAAKAYADQTVYDLPTIQATMAQLAANGVSSYKELAEAGGNLNAVAGGNAETFKSVSRSLTQSAGAGKLMTEDWNMLADAIPGASGALQKSMLDAGAYTGNFRKAMEKGEITADEFQAAILELGSQPVAVEAAKSVTTFEGALGNLQATLLSGVMGALDAIKPQLTGAISVVSDGIGSMFGFLGLAIPGIYDLIVNGDFTGAFAQAFGVGEDSPAVDFILDIRDQIQAGLQGVKDIVLGFRIGPDIAAGFDPGELPFFVTVGAQMAGIFDQIKAAVAPLLPVIMQLWSNMSPLATIFETIQPFLRPLLDVFLQLAGTVGGALISALMAVLPAVMQLQDVVVSVLQGTLAAVLPVIVQLVGMLGQTFADLLPILMPIIGTVVTLAATLISQLAPIFMELVNAVLPMVVTILGAVFAAIGPLIQIVAGLLIPIIQALMPVVVTVFSVIVQIITAAMQIVMGIIQVVTGIISGNWDQVWAGIGNIFSGIWNLIIAVVSGAIAIVRAQVMAGIGFVSGFIGGALGNIGRFFSDTWNNVVNGVSGMIGNVIGFFTGLPGQILGALGNLGNILFSAGKNIVQGLIDGIGSMMGAIGRAVINIVPEAIRGPFESLMGIHSPSLVAEYWGHMIGQGTIDGLEDMYDPVAEATALLMAPPELPRFASASALASYAAASPAPDTAYNGPLVHQDVHPSEKMSEENLANVAANKIVGALI